MTDHRDTPVDRRLALRRCGTWLAAGVLGGLTAWLISRGLAAGDRAVPGPCVRCPHRRRCHDPRACRFRKEERHERR